MANVLTFDNIVFSQYVFYSVIVLLKMVAMAVLTGRRRISGKVNFICTTGLYIAYVAYTHIII